MCPCKMHLSSLNVFTFLVNTQNSPSLTVADTVCSARSFQQYCRNLNPERSLLEEFTVFLCCNIWRFLLFPDSLLADFKHKKLEKVNSERSYCNSKAGQTTAKAKHSSSHISPENYFSAKSRAMLHNGSTNRLWNHTGKSIIPNDQLMTRASLHSTAPAHTAVTVLLCKTT